MYSFARTDAAVADTDLVDFRHFELVLEGAAMAGASERLHGSGGGRDWESCCI